jgi:hypothetical protein
MSCASLTRFPPTALFLAPLAAGLLAACASAPPPLPPPRWVPPPQSAACSDASPCENVARWFQIEAEASEAWPACHPTPLRGSEAACEKASASYARVHAEQIEYFGGLCAGMVGSNAWAIRPYVGTAQSDRIATCGGKAGIPAFTCRLWEWTWVTASNGGAFVVFMVQPEGQPAGVWAVNNCSYCEALGACREFPFRP